MDEQGDRELVIYNDPVTKKNYALILNQQDFDRAQTDQYYLNTLLNYARNNEDDSDNLTTPESEPELSEKVKSSTSWGYDETVALIKSMENHKSDLNHFKKRKQVYENISNDLLSAGYIFDATMCQNKWKSLSRSYSKCKDQKTRTGVGPSRFLFYELMDEVLGSKPSNNCDHSINSSDTKVSEKSIIDDNVLGLDTSSCSSDSVNVDKKIMERKKNSGDKNDEKLKREYMEMRIEEFSKRHKEHEEKMALEQEKIELEKKKIKLLEEYLKNKQ